MENIIVEEVCSITFQCGGWCCVSLKRGWHFANLLPGNQICQFIRGDQYMYLTSHENCYSWRCWLPLHNLSHCYCKTLVLGMVWSLGIGVSWPPIPKDILEPSHGRAFRGKFRSVYVIKCVWSLLTDLLFNRLVFLVCIWDKLVSAPIGSRFLKIRYWQQFSRLIFYPCEWWFIFITIINFINKGWNCAISTLKRQLLTIPSLLGDIPSFTYFFNF